jgi:hypothetical protein
VPASWSFPTHTPAGARNIFTATWASGAWIAAAVAGGITVVVTAIVLPLAMRRVREWDREQA